MLANVRQQADYLGMPSEDEVRELLDGPHWVDVFRLVERQFVGVHGLGLKKVAPVAGFHWRDEEPSGEASIAWHSQAVRSSSRAGGRGRLLCSRLVPVSWPITRTMRGPPGRCAAG